MVDKPTEPSVNDIPDVELLRRAIGSIRKSRREGAGQPRWSAVSDRFGLGSTYSQQLCRRFGFNPFDMVRNTQ
jgi:hypothetical protein